MVFSPDRTIFVAEKSGLIKSFDGFNDTTPTTVADLRTRLQLLGPRPARAGGRSRGSRRRPYLYALFTRDAELSGNPPNGDARRLERPMPDSSRSARRRLRRERAPLAATISGGAMTGPKRT